MYANDRQGLLMDMSKVFTEMNIDVKSMNVRTSKQGTATIEAWIYCPGKRGAWKSDRKAPADRRRAGYRTSSGVKRNENRKICNRNYQYQLLHCY